MRKITIKKILLILMLIIFSINIVNAAICDNAKNVIAASRDDAKSVAVADFNDDGFLDIVISETQSDDIIEVRLNNGFGSFSQISHSTSTDEPNDVNIVDLDRDGDIDIVSASAGTVDKIIWLENEGNGSFTSNDIASSVDDIVHTSIGDFNGDGYTDVLISIIGSLRWYENDGSQSFSSNIIEATSYGELFVIDIDGDGDLDFTTIISSVNSVFWFENDGSGIFTKRTITTTIDEPTSVYAVDLDSDGDIDIISGAYADTGSLLERALQWYDNDGLETFTTRNISTNYTQVSRLWRNIVAGDFDFDGDIDIIYGDDTEDLIILHKNDGNENFVHINLTENVNPHYILLADLNNDDAYDIIYTDTDASDVAYLSSTKCLQLSTPTFLSCDFPSLFCDNFNYNAPLMSNIENKWFIRNNDRSLNRTLKPSNGKLALNQKNKPLTAEHTTGNFPVNYRTSATTRRTFSKYSPIFSVEFDLNFGNTTDNTMEFEASSSSNQGGYVIRIEQDDDGNASGNMNWFYLNNSVSGLEYIPLCRNCTFTNTNLDIKINTFFSHRDIFPFNATIPNDDIEIYSDNILIGSISNFITDTDHLSFYAISKLSKGNFTIDNYFVMVGTDKDFDLSALGFIHLFDNTTRTDEFIVADAGTGDMAAALQSIWGDMGLKTVASRMIAGLFLMFLMAMIMFGMALKMGSPLSARVLIVVELFFMILLVFIKLLPIWLPFVVVLVAAGIGAAVTKFGTQA